MKKFIVLGLLFSQISLAGTFTVNSKVSKVINVGTVSHPVALAEVIYNTTLKAAKGISEEAVAIHFTVDGSSQVVSKSRSDVSVRVLDQLVFENNIKGTLFNVKIKTGTHKSSYEHSSVVLVKEDGDVKILH